MNVTHDYLLAEGVPVVQNGGTETLEVAMAERPGGLRRPAAAGAFYSSSALELRREIEQCYLHPLGPGSIPQVQQQPLSRPVGLVVPHAGYAYSGPIAARGFAEMASRGRPETAILLGPNHHGVGATLALPDSEGWQTPLGVAPLDRELGEELRGHMATLAVSNLAHGDEHSLEVQVPFLQHLYGASVRILPISFLDQSADTCARFGHVLAQVICGRGVAVIASTDLSHYHPQGVAQGKDQRVIEAMLSLDSYALNADVRQHAINMCGPGPVTAMLACMKHLGAKEAHLLGYATSGDTSGEYGMVVGYCSVLVETARR